MERPAKRRRSLSTDYDDSDVGDEDQRHHHHPYHPSDQADSMASARPRRAPPLASRSSLQETPSTSVSINRASVNSPSETKKSIRLTVKMPSSKLRQATSGPKSIVVNPRSAFQGGEILSGARSSRAKKPVVDASESEEDEEDEEEDYDEDADQDPEGGDEEDEDMEEDEEDADAESDSEMPDALPPARPIVSKAGRPLNPQLTVTPAPTAGRLKSFDSKQMSLLKASSATSDELSDLDDEEAEVDELDEDDDRTGDGDDGDAAESSGSEAGTATPDISKMTKRQRNRLDQAMGNDFLQLPMEPQIKKHLTAEEHAMRRAEMARRRKNLSEKRNEEEKQDTINRLLKKQAPKRKGKIGRVEETAVQQASGGPGAQSMVIGEEVEEENEKTILEERPSPLYTRWVSNRHGVTLGVPAEWKGTPVGRLFERGGGRWRALEEVEGH